MLALLVIGGLLALIAGAELVVRTARCWPAGLVFRR